VSGGRAAGARDMNGTRLTVYCDRLGWTTCLPLARALRRLSASHSLEVRVLDPVPAGWQGRWLLAVLRLAGFAATEVPFHAGHLESPDGIPAQRAAAERSMLAALPESGRVIEASPILAHIDRTWGRGTVRLALCKSLAMAFGGDQSLYGCALRVQVARALSVRDKQQAVVLIRTPAMFGATCLQEMAPDIVVQTYGAAAAFVASKLTLARQGARAAIRRLRGFHSRRVNATALAQLERTGATRRGLMVIQEDDLGLDRSYRLQPHWLLESDPPTAFNTFVVAHTSGARLPADTNALRGAGVWAVSEAELLGLSAGAPAHAAVLAARRKARQCLTTGLWSRSTTETIALAIVARLFVTAAEFAQASSRLGIRAFMTGDNYFVAGDAMVLVGESLGIHTLSYQYSNVALRSPLMMTTADVMFAFSPAYHAHWTYERLEPKAFVDIGYPYDAAFALVRSRAAATRQQLQAAGARFVIAYFDENFLPGKYGLTTFEEHREELRTLIELVLRDPAIGLVTKVQFERNSPGRIPGLEPLVREAAASGRYVDLRRGAHRNVILPAEAALAADITIGHALGGTAALEAALAGSRAIILNPYRMRDANQASYMRGDILLPSLQAALDAVAAWRRGDRPRLGDWTEILPQFDSYRDGGAARRLRAALDLLLTTEDIPAGSPDLPERLRRIALTSSATTGDNSARVHNLNDPRKPVSLNQFRQ
jgi:hypothetical protein